MVENQWNLCLARYPDNAIFLPSKIQLAFSISTDDGIINGLTNPDILASFNTNIFQISPFQITGDFKENQNAWLFVIVNNGHFGHFESTIDSSFGLE